MDTPENLRKFAQTLGVDYPLLSDPGRQIAKAYGVVKNDTSYATRWTYYVGVDGKILYIDRSVSPGSHGKAVASKLAELGVRHRRANAAPSKVIKAREAPASSKKAGGD